MPLVIAQRAYSQRLGDLVLVPSGVEATAEQGAATWSLSSLPVGLETTGQVGTPTVTSVLTAQKVTITTQPGANATSGQPLSPQPVVRLQTNGGQNVLQSGTTVTVRINTGSGTLSGSTSKVTDANGVATFTNLVLTGTGFTDTLIFESAGLTSVVSSTITEGAPALTVYYNSAEPGGDGSDPNVLWADDFSSGSPAGTYTVYGGVSAHTYNWPGGPSWWTADGDHGGYTAAQKGWFGGIFSDNTTGAIVADVGAHSAYAATGGMQDGSEGGLYMADHNFSRDVEEFWLRLYVKFLGNPDTSMDRPAQNPPFIHDPNNYEFSGTKFATLNQRSGGGIHFGDFHFNIGTGTLSTTGSFQFQPIGGSPESNSTFGFTFGPTGNCPAGHWACLQVHCKQSSSNYAPDGVLECYADDCGADGISGPPTPTLRYSRTNYRWPRSGPSDIFANVWFENWGNNASNIVPHGPIGEMRRKNVLVWNTGGPIPFRSS